ncbi:MAG TPA: tetratricopeptide repeat protein [Chthoniobacterales bacterium]|nr:tetratricopeptide repeat protein [Chthoniobacterales bacterium]
MSNLGLLQSMKKVGLILLAGFSLALAPARLVAQADDPSEVFLKAYMTSQQGEKLEHDNQLQAALSKFRFAGSLLEELKKTHADWQPAIVDYRSRKISENIVRVQSKLGNQKDLAAASNPPPTASNPPMLPTKPGPPDSTVPITKPPLVQNQAPPPAPVPAPVSQPSASVASDAVIKEATKKLQDKVDQLQAELEKSRSQFNAVAKEKDSLNGKLQETNTKLEQAQKEIEKTKGAEQEARTQLAQAEDSLKKIAGSDKQDSKKQEALRGEIAQLKKALASAEKGRVAAEKEKDAESAKVTAVTKERNQLLADLKTSKQAQERVQVLVTENTDLKTKLAIAEKNVREITADKPKKEQEVADVKRQVEQLREQLAASQQQNKEFEVTVADLRSQLQEASNELEKAKLTGGNPEETARLVKENDMLRKIVLRERQEEARREQAKKLMLAEFEKLQIKSDTLNQQIELLAQPVTKLTDAELALLRQPVVAVSDVNPASSSGTFAMAKNGPTKPPTGPTVQTTAPAVPDELAPLARDAKDNFEKGKYRAAEKQYQELLTKVPNNLYSLCNLGVVYFRTGKWKAAELTLKKAVALSPKDEFAHTTLGIVYYRQSKFDDAITELTTALGINPKSATAHNYLGITASQKGWQEAAEKEMLDALAVNPDYADAHFNLAVVYATSQPPSKEQAKLHYVKATSLGAEPDPALEKLLR